MFSPSSIVLDEDFGEKSSLPDDRKFKRYSRTLARRKFAADVTDTKKTFLEQNSAYMCRCNRQRKLQSDF